MKLTIDAGHGGSDPGAVGVNHRYEKTDALKMALALRDEMTRRGHTVTMTRTGDTYPSIRDRWQKANAAASDVFVSLHRNSAESATAQGLEVLYRSAGSVKSASNDARSRDLAQTMAQRLAAATGFRNRGAKAQNKNTSVLANTTMPAVTVEAGFVVNSDDNVRFDVTFPALIYAMADALEAEFGKVQAEPPTAADVPKPAAPTPSMPAFFQNGGVLKDKGAPYAYDANAFWAQGRLRRHHVDVVQDGKFGAKSAAGTRIFQKARISEGRDCGCPVGPDGIQIPDGKIGRKTAAILAE